MITTIKISIAGQIVELPLPKDFQRQTQEEVYAMIHSSYDDAQHFLSEYDEATIDFADKPLTNVQAKELAGAIYGEVDAKNSLAEWADVIASYRK